MIVRTRGLIELGWGPLLVVLSSETAGEGDALAVAVLQRQRRAAQQNMWTYEDPVMDGLG